MPLVTRAWLQLGSRYKQSVLHPTLDDLLLKRGSAATLAFFVQRHSKRTEELPRKDLNAFTTPSSTESLYR